MNYYNPDVVYMLKTGNYILYFLVKPIFEMLKNTVALVFMSSSQV